jgi:hypothetical protein
MIVNLTQSYRRSEQVVFRKIHDETLLVPIKNNVGDLGSIYSLNPTGAFIWECLDGTRRLGEIKTMIVDEFEVGPEQAESDLCLFVSDLLETGAIQPA